MTDIQKYSPYAVDGGADAYGQMEQDDSGDWVSFEDHQARVDAPEAKLAKAVEALRELVTCVEDGCYCSELKMATVLDEARAALTELEKE